MPASKPSRRFSALAILGLIIISLLMVVVLDSSSLVNPVVPLTGTPNQSPLPAGTLVLELFSNQNESDRLSNPTNQQFPIVGWSSILSQASNASSPYTQLYILTTNESGIVAQSLPAGPYILHLDVEALNAKIPIDVFAGNETLMSVRVFGAAYQLLYSEESNLVPTVAGAQSNIYVEINSSTSVADAGEQILLKAHEGNGGAGYLVNATVVSERPPTGGKQWLELGTASSFDPVNVTSIYLTTWRYYPFTTVEPMNPERG